MSVGREDLNQNEFYLHEFSRFFHLQNCSYSRFHHGDVLATAATGELSDEVAENAGLVSTHAYAVLDIR